jgi:hypothetical protein
MGGEERDVEAIKEMSKDVGRDDDNREEPHTAVTSETNRTARTKTTSLSPKNG